ncbi:hypothetical protein CcNV_051 [Crangon crangon nudivirus]|uniref:Uncharacterized protein n=1 Tax=Crangon crangon nudivirus TaxID=2880838 RepID=A0AAE8Y062_9VIRU|nr:hypothetical protein QKT25_gp051 [Crangon crangon nudivirus]UBZ25535.1 hypothetical protein CcNV_051 [Crangon crangon nudivirus]
MAKVEKDIIITKFVKNTVYTSPTNIKVELDLKQLHYFGYIIVFHMIEEKYYIQPADRPLASNLFIPVISGLVPITVLDQFNNIIFYDEHTDLYSPGNKKLKLFNKVNNPR